MLRGFGVFCACLVLAGCSGGGGGGSAPTTPSNATTTATVAAPVLTNLATITVDAGPAVLNTGSQAYTADNSPFVSVTLCAPGSTSNCQTIDHVLLDTGSVGLRVFNAVLNASLSAALTNETSAVGNPVGECYTFVDGYVFGSVRTADFKIGGETVAGMPFQLIGDSGAFAKAPRSCSSGGGTNLNTVQSFGANGVLGIGVTTTDCGAACTSDGGASAAIYYDCPATACASIIGRSASTSAPFQQLPNPVAAMAVDNNGTIISLPQPPAAGLASMTGTVYFGIGTQTNNGLGSAAIIPSTTSSSANGAGLVTVTYNNKTLSQSFIDSGTNLYTFVDRAITPCSATDFIGYYCPAAPQTISPTFTTATGTVSGAFTLNNAQALLSTSYTVLPGVGGNPNLFSTFDAFSSSFDFGLPFFYGRNIYTAIEGRQVGANTGPFFAF